jgi:hypothetical protein
VLHAAVCNNIEIKRMKREIKGNEKESKIRRKKKTRRVVCNCVQHPHGAFRSGPEVL